MVREDANPFRIQELERKMKGVQRQLGIVNARLDVTTKKQDRRIRDLEIMAAVHQGVSQTRVAQVYDLSTARVNQIVKNRKVA